MSICHGTLTEWRTDGHNRIYMSWSCSCWNSLTVPLETTTDDSAYTKSTPQWQDWCPPPYNHNPNPLPNPVNEDFPPFWSITLSHHYCTILPKALFSPEATMTRAVWGGEKPGHISAFPGYACETTAIGRRQPNRIHADGFYLFIFLIRPWRDAKRYGRGMWPVV